MPKYSNIPIKQREDFKGNWLSKQASGGFRRDSYGKIGDLYRYFGGIPLKNNVLYNSKYKPTNSKNPNAKYISVKDKPFIDNIIDDANRIFVDKKLQISNDDKRSDAIINDSTVSVNGYSYGKPTSAIGKYFISKGKDSKGEYISYYDVFDRDKGKKRNGFDFNSTKPFELYDRIYVNKDKDGKYIPTHTTPQIENSPIDKTKLKSWEKGANTFKHGGNINNNNNNMKTKYSKPPKHMLGAIIGVASTAMSVYNSIKANKQAKEANQVAINQRNSMLNKEDQLLLDKYPVDGNQMTGFYSKGGKIIPREIKNGAKEEMEHTSSRKVAKRIAKDHLKEDPKYYTKLKKAGLADAYPNGGKIYAYGGKTKPINWKTPDKFVNDLMGRNKSGFEFGGGKFGGAGAGRGGNPKYEDIEWIDMRTPIELGSFNDAFSKARKSGLKEFDFNGKKYNTNTSPNYDKNAGKSKVNARLRMVFDENNIIQNDSTRIEPELGQPIILPINKGKKYHSWAKGGNINLVGYNAKGGDLLPMSSNMNKVKGNTHEERTIDNTNGVKLANATGKTVAEVEDEEVIKDNKKVYSDRLYVKKGITYAQEAERVAKKIADAEKVLANPNINFRKKNAAKIQRDNWNRAAEDLFNHQEKMKQDKGINNDTTATGVPKGNIGLAIANNDFINSAFDYANAGNGNSFDYSKYAPYIDNVANAVLTATTPKPAFPLLSRQRKLKTDFNINPQLQDVTDTVNQTVSGIDRGTSSSNVARANTTAVKLAGMKAKGQLYGQKENIETGLINQDIQNQQQTENINLARIQGFNDSMQQRAYNIQGRTAANVANAVEDFNKGEQVTAYGKYQDEQLRTIRDTYTAGGSGLRVDLNNPSQIEYLKSNPLFKDNAAKDYLQKNSDGTYKYPREAQRFLENFPEYK